MTNIFSQQGAEKFIDRINNLTANTSPQWGKMNVAQMLAHCSIAYEMVYDPLKYPPIGGFKKFFLKLFVKKQVVGTKPYPKNGRTAPEFIVADERSFDVEKRKLVDFIMQAAGQGEEAFDGRESRSFGVLTKEEWNMLFAKHLDHHLTQFGV